MNPDRLEIFGDLKFQDKLEINGKPMYRSNSPPDVNTQDNYWEYEFYTDWDKGKNLLPKPSHLVKVYVTFIKKIKDNREIYETENYHRGELINLETLQSEEINSLSQPFPNSS
jgi:hypothetical protein